MKKILLALVCIAAMTASAQQYGIKYLRYDEDFSYLKDSTHRSPYERLKYIPLHTENTAWLTLGGELRYQYQLFENEEWGEAPEDRDGFILVRNLFHADLRTKSGFRFFTQLKSNSIKSREVPPKSIDVNDFDVHQAFAEFRFPTAKGEWGARVGRQEIRLGSQRLVTAREGPNNRLAFDGAR
ncbi:MAG TPA: alginate export family protein, partial [Flavobacterium sp.]|nr:alginate export family protein [Flavobacterium sp.]